MGETIVEGCLIEKRQREHSHMWRGGGCLCTYIEKLDAECITWPLLVLMVYQLRYGKYFVRRKIGVVGLKVWRVCWKCGEFVKSVNNLLKMWRICWKCEQIIESVRSLLNVWRICWKSEEFVESVKNLLKKIINRKDFSENSKMTWGCTVYTGKEKRGVRNSSIYRRIFLLSVLAIFKPIHWLVNWVCSDR